MLNSDISAALEAVAPLSLQEGYDNCGWQVGHPGQSCTGVLVCVDVTPATVREAVGLGCNLIVSHHPLLFHGLKKIVGATPQEEAVIEALANGVSIYSLHTALDNAPAPYGVSFEIASRFGLEGITPLLPESGAGTIGTLPGGDTMDHLQFAALVKRTLDAPVVRMSAPELAPRGGKIARVALCGGSGSSMIEDAIAAGADVFLTSDVTYHRFCDFASRILIADIGHFEAEECTKSLITGIISEKFPNFAIHSSRENNPIRYI